MAAMRFDLPTPDIETQPFWDGCQRGPLPRAPLQRVRRGPLLPAAVLPEVLERRRRVEGGDRAAARSTRTRSCIQNDLPPFNERVPYVAAVVELDEGPRVMTNIEGTPLDELRVGMPVTVDFKPLDDEITIAVFRAAAA